MADSTVVNGASPPVEVGALIDEQQRATQQRAIRFAEQAAYAERMRRIEVQEELARRTREQTEADVLRVDLAAARERIREMNHEREQLRRDVAEAEHRAAVLACRAPKEAIAAVDADPTIGPVDAGRLEAALSRLRETVPAPESDEHASASEIAWASRAWIDPVFGAMAKRDPAGAGRLALALLPAQPLVQPLPLSYDLVLSDLGCVSVIAAGGRAAVEVRDVARPREHVQLVVRGELASFARLLGAGPVRRRLVRRGLARARGSASTLRALRGLIRAPLSLSQLRAAGVCPSPELSLSLIAAMIHADWTKGETFTIAHREPELPVARACLRVRDGAPVVAGDPAECGLGDLAAMATTIVCPSASLLAVLDDGGGDEVALEGESRPLAVIQSWVKRAQSA